MILQIKKNNVSSVLSVMTLLHFIIPIYCSLKLVSVGGANMEIGNTIDLFRNYGLLMRIFPFDVVHHDFMSNEFSTNVFDKVMSKRVLTVTDQLTEGTWKMKVCQSILQVLHEMLTDYKIEYVDNIHNSFSTFWALKVLAEFIGLHHVFLANNNFSFVLVQHKRCLTRSEFSELARVNPVLEEKFAETVRHVVYGDFRSVLNLTSQFGTHYVKSFSAGVMIYQVIAFPNRYYECFSNNVQPEFTLEDLRKCANGSHIHPGRIRTLGDPKALDDILNSRYKNKKYEISTIYNVKNKFSEFCYSSDNLAITGFSLSAISDLISDRKKSTFVREVIDNQMKLRELIL